MLSAHVHGILTSRLVAFGVNGSGGQILVEQEIVETVDGKLGVAEDESPSGLFLRHQVVPGSLLLVIWADLLDDLLDVLVRLSRTAETNAEVVLSHKLSSHETRSLGKGRREEQE